VTSCQQKNARYLSSAGGVPRLLPYPLIQTQRAHTEDKALYHKCGQAQTIISKNHLHEMKRMDWSL